MRYQRRTMKKFLIGMEIHSMLAACFRLVHDDCTKCTLHVTGVSTWWLYHFCTIACYGTVTIIFLIVTVNMEYHIIVLIARDFAFQISFISAEFGFSRFCWVSCSLCFFAWVRFKVRWSWRICNSLTVQSRLRHKSLTWTQNLNLDSNLQLVLESSTGTGTHISVEVIMFLQLPNSY